ncbi:hypothetical protein WICMUC_004324 [Wickerhamomyces mucosus]|uniref:Lysophospholipid acyltransferase n=1 Tax=Wickerhamomyces mucosus TaxID=1378264 RepID=A0A9P8PIB6_9ASCO|nr:hypothetical protein WICMUC_004324 [Wickerhamomyces mucosus]
MVTNIVAEQIRQWSEASGVDEATLKMAICLFGSFPLNAILKRLPDKKILLKNVYIISISAFYLFIVCELFSGFRTLFISTTFTYIITRYLKSDLMPIINFIFVMGHLALNHLYLQFFNEYDSTKIDITGAQMVLCIKLTSFAWNVYDGRQNESGLSQAQKDKAVVEHPSILNFLSYAFFYPSLLTGPSFEYKDYEQWLNNEMFSDLPESKKPGKKRKRNIPRSGKVTFYRVLQGVAWLLVWQKSNEYVSSSYLFTDSFSRNSFVYRVVYIYILGFTYRLKYYAAWTISEASCILTGLGYNGYDQETKTIKWDRVQNIDIFGVETAQNIHTVLSSWNQNTNVWLKNYVYLRVTPPGKKPGFRATFFTFITSAFWHGTRPGYYLSFATGALIQTCGKFYRRNFRPIFLKEDRKTPKSIKIIYDIVSFLVTQISLSYLVQPFVILDLDKSLHVWGSVNYFVHIGIAITLISFQGPFAKQISGFFKNYHSIEPESGIKKLRNADKSLSKLQRTDSQPSNLAYPAADFTKTDLKEIVKELEEFKHDVQEWSEKHGDGEEKHFKEAIEGVSKDIEKVKALGKGTTGFEASASKNE